MTDLMIINETIKTPKILLDYKSGVLEVNGRCLPEDCFSFFKQIIEWIDNYIDKAKNMILILNFDYCSNQSEIYILEI